MNSATYQTSDGHPWLSSTKRPLMRYGLAFVAVALAMGFRLALTAWLGPGLPVYITFYPAVVAVALVAGFGPGVLATVLASTVAVCCILPRAGWILSTPMDAVAMVIFIAMGGFVSVLAELYRRDRVKAAAYDHDAMLRENQEALRTSEERWRYALEVSELGAWELNLVDHSAWRSPRHDQIFGYPELLPEWTYEDFLRHVVEEERAGVDQCFQQAVATHKDWSFECRILRNDGPVRWIWAYGKTTLDADGNPVRMFGLVADITKRKQAEIEAAQLVAIVASSDDAIIGKDLSGVVTSWNAGAERVFGYPASEMIGQSILRLVPEDRREEEKWILDQVRSGESIEHFDTVRLRKDGSRFYISLTVSPIKDASGKIIGASKVARDITRRRAAEAEILRLNTDLERRVLERTAQLESANKELEAFSYSVSHDLRAPLRAVNGFVRILQKDYASKLDTEGLRLFEVVVSEAQRMGRLIDDLLTFSRLGRQQKESVDVDMTALARAEFEGLTMSAPDAAPHLDLRPLPAAKGDPAMLRQAFANLIGNALKFSRNKANPTIEIGGTSDNGVATYHVKDNGVGFDQKYSDKLFGVFQRLHTQEEFEGTGIGLSLVQRIINRHGGNLWAEGKPGVGATFSFTLPTGESSPVNRPLLMDEPRTEDAG